MPRSHEADAGAVRAPTVAQPVWIEETLKDPSCGVAEKPNGGYEQQRTTERLPEDGYERRASERADDHVEHTFHTKARARATRARRSRS